MKRIMLIGSGGAGKTTLARKLGEVLGIEVIHLDALFWKPDWQTTPRDEWTRIQEELVKRENWVMDGNFTSTQEVRFQAADTVIFLDYPRLLCVYRALKRIFKNLGRTRPDMGEGCPERLDWKFIKWVLDYPKLYRAKILERINKFGDGRKVVILRSPRETERFLQSLAREHNVC